MHDDRCRARILTRCSTVRVSAQTGQPVGVRIGGQHAQRIGQPLGLRARIGVAHGGRDRGEPGLQDGGVGGQQSPEDSCGAAGVLGAAELQIARLGCTAGARHRGGIEFLDPHVDAVLEVLLRQRSQRGRDAGQGGVDESQGVFVDHQAGAPGDRGGDFRRDLAGGQQRPDFR